MRNTAWWLFGRAEILLIVLLMLSSVLLGINFIKDSLQETHAAASNSEQAAVDIAPVGKDETQISQNLFDMSEQVLIEVPFVDTQVEIDGTLSESDTLPEEISFDLVLSSLPAFDIIIQAGQSNAVGAGRGDVENPYQPRDDIWYMDSDFQFVVAHEHEFDDGSPRSNFSLTFAEEYVKSGLLGEGRKVLILRAAVGGTGFYNGRWGLEDDLYLRMLGMISATLSLNPENKLVAILWSQGEADVVNPLNVGDIHTHYNNLYALVSNVRVIFNAPELPFIACDFAERWKADKGAEAVDPILDAIRKVCNDIGYAAFIPADGLQVNDDIIGNEDLGHFTRESLYILGRKFFEAFKFITESM